jgi:hypothetical protein
MSEPRGPQRVPATRPTGKRARDGNPPVDGGTIARANRALRWHARRAAERALAAPQEPDPTNTPPS